MTRRILILFLFAISTSNGLHSQKLTIAFTRISSLKTSAKVYANGSEVGHVIDFKTDKNVDTIFVIIKLLPKKRIPKGSIFFIDENLLGDGKITVEYSTETTPLTPKDVSIGVFRPLQFISRSQLDSVTQKISRPRVVSSDTLKH